MRRESYICQPRGCIYTTTSKLKVPRAIRRFRYFQNFQQLQIHTGRSLASPQQNNSRIGTLAPLVAEYQSYHHKCVGFKLLFGKSSTDVNDYENWFICDECITQERFLREVNDVIEDFTIGIIDEENQYLESVFNPETKVVNFEMDIYMKLLEEKCGTFLLVGPCSIWNHSGGQAFIRETQRLQKLAVINDVKLVITAVHNSGHYFLIAADVEQATITYYDSYVGMRNLKNMDRQTRSAAALVPSCKPLAQFRSTAQAFDTMKSDLQIIRESQSRGSSFRNYWKDNISLIERLGISQKLTAHSGCVNTIAWSDDGSVLLSGSDDTRLVVSHPFKSTPVHNCVVSGHTRNIYSARFLPATSNSLVVSCGADGLVILTDIERTDTHATFVLSCSSSPVYEVCPMSDSPHCFMFCGEDGCVRLVDRRLKSVCGPCKQDVVIDCSKPLTAIDVVDNLVAVGCEDSTVRLHDIRSGFANHSVCVMPKSTSRNPHNRRVTSVEIDPYSRTVLTSVSCHHIYLYSLLDRRSSNDALDLTSPGRAQCPPPTKIRLRGDWTDTGPQDSSEPSGSSLVQSLGRVVTSWYDRARAETPNDSVQVNVPTTGAQISTARMQMHCSDDSSNSDNAENEGGSPPRSRATQLRTMAKQARILREHRETQALNQLNALPQQAIIHQYSGHRNARTMMKQATFWGNDYIMSGSDCGNIFIWNRHTNKIVGVLQGDSRVVNCVQPHPNLPILASSGIDYDIKMWYPCLQEAQISSQEIQKIVCRNAEMLEETQDTVSIPAAYMFRMMARMHRLRDERRAEQRRAQQNEPNIEDDPSPF